MKNLQLICGIYQQPSSVKTSLRFDLKWHAFKGLFEAKKLILLRTHLGHNTEYNLQVLMQKIGNIVHPDTYYQKKGGGTITAKMGCIEPLKQRDKKN